MITNSQALELTTHGPREIREDNLAKRYLEVFKKMKSERANQNNTWQAVSHYFMPTHGSFNFQPVSGQPKDPFVMDSTGRQCLQQLASNIYQSATNPSARWFELSLKQKLFHIPLEDGTTETLDLSEDIDVVNYLKTCSDVIYKVFSSPHTKFEPLNFELIFNVVGYGTGVLYVGHEAGDYIQFQNIPLNECYLSENYRGQVDTVYRQFKYTVKQAYERWEDKAGATILEMFREGQMDKEYEFLHVVHPSDKTGHLGQASNGQAFYSGWINCKDAIVIQSGSYKKMPYLTPRWMKEASSPYGVSQPILALGDIKQLNRMVMVSTMAQEMQINPPLLIADDGVLSKPKIGPGGLNYSSLSADGKPQIQALQTNSRLDLATAAEELVRARLRAAFFIDLINLPQNPNMTATEVMTRSQERFRIMGPMAGRLESEYCGPLIERVFDILEANGALPPRPDVLADHEFNVEYLGPLARAQKNLDAYAFLQFVETVAPMIELQPEVLDNFNLDAQFRYNALLFGLAQGSLRDLDEVEQTRAERKDQSNAMNQQANEAQNVVALKDLAKAKYDFRRADAV